MNAACPNCANGVEIDALECKKCGASFAAGAAWKPVPADPNKKAEIRHPVEFTASAGEYFRIWIVNLALTLLTLGVYSAWAKVRKKRYFYGHTRIDGDAFEYRGSPIAILKGRAIAVAAVGAGYGMGHFAPDLLWVVVIAAIVGVPWLIVRSLTFNAHNSAYRNVRFGFSGAYSAFLRRTLGYGLLAVVTFGLGYPYLKAKVLEFAARNLHFGGTTCKMPDLTSGCYSIFWGTIGYGVLGALPVGLIATIEVPVFTVTASYVVYGAIVAYTRARTANMVWNNLSIGHLRFECALSARDLAWLYIVNILAIIATLSLATPWAAVRTMRYRAGKLTLVTAGGLDQFVAGESSQVGAAGEELGEMFDIDIGL